MVQIQESGMVFGEYDERYFFHIERSVQYTERLCKNGIASCEFILRREKKLYFIEAKSSCPRPPALCLSPQNESEQRQRYNEYIEGIVLKMRHSLALYGSILLKRHSQDGVPVELRNRNLSGQKIYLILVINTRDNWTPDPALQEDLQLRLKSERMLWDIAGIFVLTPQKAVELRFIIPPQRHTPQVLGHP